MLHAYGIILHGINVWVLPSSDNTISEEFSLTLPAEVLEGSARVTFSVIGEKGFLCSWVCSEKKINAQSFGLTEH